MGKVPQVKEVIYNGNVESPNFIGNIHFEKIDFEPIVANPVLEPDANLTDIIQQFGMGSSLKILISGKLRAILENFRDDGMQFFQCSIFQNGIEYKDYWLLNMYIINNEYIDFNKSTIHYKKREIGVVHTPEIFKVNNLEEFNLKLKNKDMHDELYIKNTHMTEVKNDFFLLKKVQGGVGYFVSEKLKKEIEDASCTGIEFQPSELSYHEWSVSGGEREKVYGKSW